MTRGGSFRDPLERTGPAARAEQDSSWNERDPQLPKSNWWLSDGPFVGFRVVTSGNESALGCARAHGEASRLVDFRDNQVEESTYMTRQPSPITRRTFVQTTTAAAAAMMFPSGVHAQGSDVIRVGVIGTGGRGTGAIANMLQVVRRGSRSRRSAISNPDRLEQSRIEPRQGGRRAIRRSAPKYKAGFKVTGEHVYTGFDAYKKVLASDVDLVILATPPGFRPMHLAAAVAAGKHVFTEKPVATDSVGIRSVLATYEAALKKNLAIVAGTQRRHQAEYLETIKRLHDGAIGDIVSGQVFWNQGGLWNHARQPNWSDTEWQIRNWLYFAWLSGDHIVEQHVHNIDVANWVLRRTSGQGGRRRAAGSSAPIRSTATSTITSPSTSSTRAAPA